MTKLKADPDALPTKCARVGCGHDRIFHRYVIRLTKIYRERCKYCECPSFIGRG